MATRVSGDARSRTDRLLRSTCARLVQSWRNRRAALRFFRKLLKRQGCVPRRLITDKLRSYLVLSKNEIVGLTAGHVSRC